MHEDNRPITMVVPCPSSRLYPEVMSFLVKVGFSRPMGRSLWQYQDDFLCLFLRGTDIPVVIEQGYGDIGITGLDVILEAEADVVIVSKLGLRYSRVIVGKSKKDNTDFDAEPRKELHVVTEYPNLTRKYFESKGLSVRILTVHGSAEAFAALPRIDYIVTLQTTGRSIIDNKMEVVDTILETHACLIANNCSLGQRRAEMQEILNKLHPHKSGNSMN